MNRWVGKVAVVTGASAGVGAAVAVELVKQGLTVVGVARRVEKVEELQSQVAGASGKLVPYQADVSKEQEIKDLFSFVQKSFGSVHALINNAGFMVQGKFIDGEPADWRRVLDLNVIGLATCSKEAVALMRATGVDDGHIINVNSTAGHRIPPVANPNFNIYPPSKYAVKAISETLRRELNYINSKIRVTNLSPGYIKTVFLAVSVSHDPAALEAMSEVFKNRPALASADLAEAVVYILSAPPHVLVHELILTGI